MEEFMKLWNEILEQPNVSDIQIIVFRGSLPKNSDDYRNYTFRVTGTSKNPIDMLKDSLEYLKEHPPEVSEDRGMYEYPIGSGNWQDIPPKKRGRKKRLPQNA